jgi:hypothetical protein
MIRNEIGSEKKFSAMMSDARTPVEKRPSHQNSIIDNTSNQNPSSMTQTEIIKSH